MPYEPIHFGIFPRADLHVKKPLLVQEFSYALLWYGSFFVAISLLFLFIPSKPDGMLVLKLVGGGACLLTGLLICLVFFCKEKTFIIDLDKKIVDIGNGRKIPVCAVMGLQLLKRDFNPPMDGGDAPTIKTAYQLNLVFMNEKGIAERLCISTEAHDSKWLANLAKRYEKLCGMKILKPTQNSC